MLFHLSTVTYDCELPVDKIKTNIITSLNKYLKFSNTEIFAESLYWIHRYSKPITPVYTNHYSIIERNFLELPKDFVIEVKHKNDCIYIDVADVESGDTFTFCIIEL